MKELFTFFTILLFLSSTLYSQQRECEKMYNISGINNEGVNTSFVITLKQKCYDFSETESIKEIEFEKSNTYYGFDYTLIAPPSKKTNCAGLGFYRLFGIGPFNYDTDDFDKIISNFGKVVYNPGDLTWGGVRKGDIVMYRKDNKPLHVAIVNSVNSTQTQVTIESKCDDQATYLHPMGVFYIGETDPLVNNYGNPYIYNIDVKRIKVEKIKENCNCDENKPGLVSETKEVRNDKPEKIYTTDILEEGATYLIEASGQVSDWDTKNPVGVDPCYCYIQWRCPTPEPWGQLIIDGKNMHQINGSTIPYNPGHTYSVKYTGTGKKMELYCSDAQGSSGDNSGKFKVVITKQ